MQDVEAVACVFWTGQLDLAKIKKKKWGGDEIWVCSPGGISVLGAGPRESEGRSGRAASSSPTSSF